MRLLLHRWADTQLRTENRRLRSESFALRRTVTAVTRAAANRTARIGLLEHALAEARLEIRELRSDR